MTLLTIDLRVDAAAEAERLEAARALARPGDSGEPGDAGDDLALAQLEGEGAWTIAAQSARSRRLLGRRVLLLWRIAYEDAGGRIVESHLVPIVVLRSGAGRRVRLRRRAQIDALVGAVEDDAVEMVERRSDEWRIAVERTTGAFAKTRAARACAIALDGTDHARRDPRFFQPGLFDRRAARLAQTAAGPPGTIGPLPAATRRPRLQLVVVP
jgi:hypothetical protein